MVRSRHATWEDHRRRNTDTQRRVGSVSLFNRRRFMFSHLRSAASAALYLLLAGSSLASPCTDRINALEARVNEAAEATGSLSSGGQGVAAARESQAMQARNQGEPISPATVPPFQNETTEAQTTRQAADAGG